MNHNNCKKIKDVQKKFAEVYPFLKIEFYKNPYPEKELSRTKDKITPEKSSVQNEGKPLITAHLKCKTNMVNQFPGLKQIVKVNEMFPGCMIIVIINIHIIKNILEYVH